MDKQRAIAIEDLAEEQESYIDITGDGPVPMAQWYAIQHAIDDMEKLDKVEKVVKNVKLSEDCYNAIVKIKDILGLSK